MRKNIFSLISILVILAVSLLAQVASLTSQNETNPPMPFYMKGSVLYKGFNLNSCDSSISICTDVQARCGTFTYSGISIGILPESGKSGYSADIPGDIIGTEAIEGCSAGAEVAFTIKGEPAEQLPAIWVEGLPLEYDLSFGSPSLIFLPMIHR